MHGSAAFTKYVTHNPILFFFSSDITIARSQTPKNILQLADEIGLLPSEVSAYGNKKAKVSLSVINRLKQQKDGKYIVCVG